jgi:hypothetical protein
MAATKQHVITIGSQKYAYRALPRYKDLEGVTGIKEASTTEKFTDNATSIDDLIRSGKVTRVRVSYNTGTSPNLKSKSYMILCVTSKLNSIANLVGKKINQQTITSSNIPLRRTLR